MKKMAILGVVFLVLIFVSFMIKQQESPQYQTSASIKTEMIERILNESTELCREVRLTNELLKSGIFALMRSKNQNPKIRIEIARLIINVEKADKLIKENEKSLEKDNFRENPEKLIKLKDKFQEINDLHLKVADDLNALQISQPKMVPGIKI